MRIIGDTKIDFISKRKIAFAISSLISLAGLLSIILLSMGKGNVGIQFTGGTAVEGYFSNPVDESEIRDALGCG